jgi:hypothetical protein
MLVSFFDDDAEATQVKAPTPRPRRKRSRSRLRIQRLIIALVALFVLVFVLALVVRSCQQNAKESTYRTYFSQVQGVVTDSTNDVGKPIAALLADPTRYSKSQLQDKLQAIYDKQNEITTRTEKISPPGKLKALHDILIQGQQVRLAGVKQVQDGLAAALTGKHLHATARKLAALSGYFTGPDVYYNELYYTQAQGIMKKDGVSNVAVPAPTGYFAGNTAFSPSALSAALSNISSSTKLNGTRGVALGHVAIKGNGKTVTLSSSGSTNVKATVGMLVVVTVQNPGNVVETNVPVKVTWTGPGGSSVQNLTATIPSIAVHAEESVDVSGLSIPTTAITKTSKLTVVAGPVPGEKVLSNNHATFVIVPGL